MDSRIRIRLRTGSREIELEGPRDVVETLLERWWLSQDGIEDSPDDNEEALPAREASRVPRRKGRKRSTSAEASTGATATDLQGIVNSIREHDSYERFESKVLHEADKYRMVALVSWIAKMPLTSGEIQKVLTALNVKISGPTTSKVIKANSSNFTQDETRTPGAHPKYLLTGKAAKEFGVWLADEQ